MSLSRKLQAGSVQHYEKGDSGGVFFLRVLLLIAPVWKNALIGLFLLFLRGPRVDPKHALRFLRSTFLKKHDKQDMDNTNNRCVKTLKGAKAALKRLEISNLFIWEVRKKIDKIWSAALPNFKNSSYKTLRDFKPVLLGGKGKNRKNSKCCTPKLFPWAPDR